MGITRRRVTDAQDMAALAHPLRLDLLELLLVDGPLTASEAGRRLGQLPSNVSWHLRKLAEHGFVRQSTSSVGRQRPWRIVAESLSWGDDADDSAASSALRDVALERELQLLRGALAAHLDRTAEWQEATRLTAARLWLTPSEAKELGARTAALAEPYLDRLSDARSRPEGAALVAMMTWLVPVPAGPVRPDPAEPPTPDSADPGC
jgi:DNA-binding transcriptional ArsR family regulator